MPVFICFSVIYLYLFGFIFSCSQPSAKDTKNISKADFHYKLARNNYDDGNVQEAIRELHVSLNYDPDNTDSYYLLGFIYLGRHQYNEAIHALKSAIQIKHDFLEAINNLGAVYIAIARYEDAIATLKPLSENPYYPTPHLVLGNIGWAYFKLKNYDKALSYLEKSTFINPKFCLGYNNTGLVYQSINKVENAIQNFERAIKFCPDYAEPYFHIGTINAHQGKSELSQEAYKKCFDMAKDTPMGQRCKNKL